MHIKQLHNHLATISYYWHVIHAFWSQSQPNCQLTVLTYTYTLLIIYHALVQYHNFYIIPFFNFYKLSSPIKNYPNLFGRIKRKIICTCTSDGCTSDGKYVVLGFYDAIAQKLDWYEKERFFGNRGPPPDSPDSTRIRRWPITVSFKVNSSSRSQLANTQYVIHITHYETFFQLYVVVMAFVLVGVVLAISLLIFNAKYMARRFVSL